VLVVAHPEPQVVAQPAAKEGEWRGGRDARIRERVIEGFLAKVVVVVVVVGKKVVWGVFGGPLS
jgi:hypothetical protein